MCDLPLLLAYALSLLVFLLWREHAFKKLVRRLEELSKGVKQDLADNEKHITTLKNLQSWFVIHKLSTSEDPTKVGS